MKETQSICKGIVLFLLLFMVVFWACITTQVTRLNQNEYPPGDPSDVIVYLTPEDIKSEYEKIALIHMQGEGSWTNEQQMFEKAKQKAATLGANGIILGEVNEPSEGAKIAGAIFGTGTTRRDMWLRYMFTRMTIQIISPIHLKAFLKRKTQAGFITLPCQEMAPN